MALRPVSLIIPPFLMGLGQFAASLRNTIFGIVLFPVAFVVGSHWGLVGVCVAWLAAVPVQLLVLMRRVARISHTSIGDLAAAISPPLAGSVLMYLSVRTVAAVLPNWPVWGSFGALVAIGVVVYLLFGLLFMRPRFAELFDLVRR
jgi:teichuronic acid exporter